MPPPPQPTSLLLLCACLLLPSLPCCCAVSATSGGGAATAAADGGYGLRFDSVADRTALVEEVAARREAAYGAAALAHEAAYGDDADAERARRQRARWAWGSTDAAALRRVRKVVRAVCATADAGGGVVGVPDERTICFERGARVARDLGRFRAAGVQRTFGRRDVARAAAMFDAPGAGGERSLGLWVRVDDGQVVDYKVLGRLPWTDAVVSHALAFLAYAHKLGAFAGHTFEFVATLRDTCEDDPLARRMNESARYAEGVPILSYSRLLNRSACGHHVPVPVTPWIHSYWQSDWSSPTEWRRLANTAVFRGEYNNVRRLQLAVLSQVGLLDADVELTCAMAPEDAASRCTADVAALSAVRNALPPSVLLHPSFLQRLCDPADIAARIEAGRSKGADPANAGERRRRIQWRNRGRRRNETVCGGAFDQAFDQTEFKYLLVPEGTGGVQRLGRYLAAPGVVVSVGEEYEQFFTEDLRPFVHYVAAEAPLHRTPVSLNATLEWLRRNDGEAADISTRASLFYARHVSSRAKARFFQLFAALYAARWNDTKPAAPAAAGGNATTGADAEADSAEEAAEEEGSGVEEYVTGLDAKARAELGPVTCATLEKHLERRTFRQHGYWVHVACAGLAEDRMLDEKKVLFNGGEGKRIKRAGRHEGEGPAVVVVGKTGKPAVPALPPRGDGDWSPERQQAAGSRVYTDAFESNVFLQSREREREAAVVDVHPVEIIARLRARGVQPARRSGDVAKAGCAAVLLVAVFLFSGRRVFVVTFASIMVMSLSSAASF
eukprot:Rhum_TRINITY_DN11810_c1_g1::Rhum_TRINITY_DN11810_c1_g1_i1::g.47214::m.47214